MTTIDIFLLIAGMAMVGIFSYVLGRTHGRGEVFREIKEKGISTTDNTRIVGHVETLKGWEKD